MLLNVHSYLYSSLFLLFGLLIGCASEKEDIKNTNAARLFTKGNMLLKHGDYSEAAEAFNQVESLFPYSSKVPVSQILAAYSNFLAANYMDATRELDIFMRYHSSHQLMSYDLYLRAMPSEIPLQHVK